MRLNLNPGKCDYQEMKGWLKQANELIWRKPFAFTIGLFISALPGFFFWLVTNLLGAIDVPGALNIVIFILFIGIMLLMISISPVGIIMNMIAEKADNNERIDWLTELFLIYTISFRAFFRRTIKTVGFLSKCFFIVCMFMVVIMGLVALMDYLFNFFPSSGGQPNPLIELKSTGVSRPDPIFWIESFKTYSNFYIFNVFFVVTSCPYFYGLLIHKGVIDSEYSHCFVLNNIEEFELIWFAPYAVYFIAICFALDFPVWNITGWIGIAAGILLTIYFWVFGYVVARDKFLGVKKNQEQESMSTSDTTQSVEA